MTVQKNISLSSYTTFYTGGPAEVFAVVASKDELVEVLQAQPRPFWLLGEGANSLISDSGLPGTTIKIEMNKIIFEDDLAIAEAGADWDTFVQACIARELWGLELTSGIPSSVGGAVVGNIAAYGQAVSDTLVWVETINYDEPTPTAHKILTNELDFSYRSSVFSKNPASSTIIVRAAFKLSGSPNKELTYESALKIAAEHKLDTATLEGRRQTILLARGRAGSLLDKKHPQKTAGSFFKNPVVSVAQAEAIMAHEERPITRGQIMAQNRVHSGDSLRVSAAHVLLAAGFKRGQTWGSVRLHPDHILKIENTGGATSQQIYDVAQEIVHTVKEKLQIELIPEVRFIGTFT